MAPARKPGTLSFIGIDMNNQNQKGAMMKTNSWISYSIVVLGVITAASALSTLVLSLLNQPLPNAIITIGLVALAGLVRLLISPLNRG